MFKRRPKHGRCEDFLISMDSKWSVTQQFPVNGKVVGITMDNANNVYFTIRTGLWKVNLKDDTKPTCLLEKSVLRNVIWTPSEKLYICNFADHNIIQYDITSGSECIYAGTGNRGYADRPLKQAEFACPWGLALDSDGNMLVCDKHHVRKIDMINETVETLAGRGPEIAGAGFVNGPARASSFNYPMGLARSESGEIYVCDCSNSQIRCLNNSEVCSIPCIVPTR